MYTLTCLWSSTGGWSISSLGSGLHGGASGVWRLEAYYRQAVRFYLYVFFFFNLGFSICQFEVTVYLTVIIVSFVIKFYIMFFTCLPVVCVTVSVVCEMFNWLIN